MIRDIKDTIVSPSGEDSRDQSEIESVFEAEEQIHSSPKSPIRQEIKLSDRFHQVDHETVEEPTDHYNYGAALSKSVALPSSLFQTFQLSVLQDGCWGANEHHHDEPSVGQLENEEQQVSQELIRKNVVETGPILLSGPYRPQMVPEAAVDVEAGPQYYEEQDKPSPSCQPPEVMCEREVKDPEPLVFVAVMVKYPRFMLFIHAVFLIACTVFVLPFITLSNPDAGLRLRNDPMADRADGFIASALAIRPAFDTVTSVDESDMHFDTDYQPRSEASAPLTLFWYTDPPEDIFNEKHLEVIRAFEERLFNLPTYQNQLCQLASSGSSQGNATCLPFRSPVPYLLKESDQSIPMKNRVARLFKREPFYFASQYLTHNQSNITRTEIPIGRPLDGFHSAKDRRQAQMQLLNEIFDREIVPLIANKAFYDKTNPRLTYYQDQIIQSQARTILAQDLTLSFIAICCIALCVLVHTQSLFVTIGGMLQIGASFPVSLFLYRLVFGIKLFGGLHVLAIFLILAIGVDDCFIFFDSFDQVSRHFPDKSRMFRMNHAFKTSFFAMFATSVTTSVCFLALLSCGIPALYYFGVFCAIMILVNFFLVMTFFAAVLVIWDAHFRLWKSDKLNSCWAKFKTCACRRKAVSPIETEVLASKTSCSERFFRILGERFITTNTGRIVIITGTFAFVGTMVYYASKLHAGTSMDSFWMVGHPFRICEELANTQYLIGAPKASIRFVNGLKAPFRSEYDPADNVDFGKPIYDSEFDITQPDVQVFVVEQCDEIRSQLAHSPDLFSLGGSSFCPINDFRDFLLGKGIAFPVRNRTDAVLLLLDYLQRTRTADPQDTVGEDGTPDLSGAGRSGPLQGFGWLNELEPTSIPKIVFNQFDTTRSQRGDDLEDRSKLWQAWSRFNRKSEKMPVHALGVDGSTAPVDGFYEVWMQTQSQLLNQALTNVSFSIAVAFIMLFIATYGDVYVSIVGTICLASSVVSTLGFMSLMGWSLGVVEAIACTIVAGIAEDYILHMCIAFSERAFEVNHHADGTTSPKNSKQRVIESLEKVGISVLFGALTMFAAAAILLFTTLSVLVRFGQFLVIVVICSITIAIFLNMALLSLPVPINRRLLAPSRSQKASSPSMSKDGERGLAQEPEDEEHSLLSRMCCFTITFHSPPVKVVLVLYTLVLLTCTIAVIFIGLFTPSSNSTPVEMVAAAKKGGDLRLVRVLSEDTAFIRTAASTSIMDLPTGTWSEIRLDGENNGCAAPGEAYSFFVYRASMEEGPTSSITVKETSIFVEFEGGFHDTCHSKDSCKRPSIVSNVHAARKRLIPTEVVGPSLAGIRAGITVFFPHCTADAFLGNGTVHYNDGFFEVRHFGQSNARSGMDWVMHQLDVIRQTNRVEPITSMSFQGCGVGGLGAMSVASWAAPKLREEYGIVDISLIADSSLGIVNPVHPWKISFDAVVNVQSLSHQLNKKVLLASSAYDWFQARFNMFGRNIAQFRSTVETNSDLFDFARILPGDGHCVVLNPFPSTQEFRMDEDLETSVLAFISSPDLTFSPLELRSKCGQGSNAPCHRHVDLRAYDVRSEDLQAF